MLLVGRCASFACQYKIVQDQHAGLPQEFMTILVLLALPKLSTRASMTSDSKSKLNEETGSRSLGPGRHRAPWVTFQRKRVYTTIQFPNLPEELVRIPMSQFRSYISRYGSGLSLFPGYGKPACEFGVTLARIWGIYIYIYGMHIYACHIPSCRSVEAAKLAIHKDPM